MSNSHTITGERLCQKCNLVKKDEDFYPAYNGKYTRHICKICHKKQLISYRRLEDSYAWWYRKLNNIKKSAQRMGVEFSLTYDDYENIRTEDECYFCRTDCDIVGLTRVDRTKGYTPENTHLICRLCRIFHNYKMYKFNEKELLMIGGAVNRYYKRTRNVRVAKEPEVPYTAGDDIEYIKKVLAEKD